MAWLLARILPSRILRRSLVVVLAPAPPRSLGDEAIIRGLIHSLDSADDRIRFVESSTTERCQGWAAVLGVGRQSPSLSSRFAGMAHLALFLRAADVYVLGADVLDGYYSPRRSRRRIDFARLAERANASVSIVSYSLNPQPEPTVLRALQTIPPTVRFVARDPLSAARTAEFIGREVVLGADLAFLAADGPRATSVRAGSVCFVPNAALSGWCGGYDNLVHTLNGAIRELLVSPYVRSVQLMPHDLRKADTDGDIALCRTLVDLLSDEECDVSMTVPQDALDARAILGSADVVLTARMHAAIGALCEARPLLLIGYQGKAEGLLDAFGLTDQLLEPSSLSDYSTLRSSVEETFERAEEIRTRIAAKFPEVASRARLNLAELAEH